MSGYGIHIVLGGKERRLRYDLNALAEVENRLNISSFTQLKDTVIGFKTVRTLIWAGLAHEDPALTETDVGAWIGPGGVSMLDAMQKVVEAFVEATGPKNPTMPESKAPVSGTGPASDESGLANSN